MVSGVTPVKGSKAAAEPPWHQIDSDRWSYLARAIEGEFPNWKQVVPRVDGDWTMVEVQPDGMEAMLEAIPLLPGADLTDQPVSLDVAVKGLTLRAQGPGGKGSNAGANCGRPGHQENRSKISVNRNYLHKALRFGFASIQILDPVTPIVFTREGKTMVVIPLRGLEAEAHQAATEYSPFSIKRTVPAATPSAAEEAETNGKN